MQIIHHYQHIHRICFKQNADF